MQVNREFQMKNILTKRTVYGFWAVMDILALIGQILAVALIIEALGRQNILAYFVLLYASVNSLPDVWVLLERLIIPIVLTASLPFTAWLFFKQHSRARSAAYWQSPFRVLLLAPSLAFIPALMAYQDWNSPTQWYVAVIAVEICKVISLEYVQRMTPPASCTKGSARP